MPLGDWPRPPTEAELYQRRIEKHRRYRENNREWINKKQREARRKG